MSGISYLIKGDSINILLNGKMKVIPKDDTVLCKRIIKAISEQKTEEEILQMLEIKYDVKVEKENVISNLVVDKGKITYNGEEIRTKGISDRIIFMHENGLPLEPMINFLNNLYENPSLRAVEEMYRFLEKNDLPITEDGCFLAYKTINENYTDYHTGKIDNSIGKIVKMKRNEVDDNSDISCSRGLHAGSFSYFGSSDGIYGKRFIIVKINPKDVVSIPKDYDSAKLRCCEYFVLKEIEKKEALRSNFVQENKETIDDKVDYEDFEDNAKEDYISSYLKSRQIIDDKGDIIKPVQKCNAFRHFNNYFNTTYDYNDYSVFNLQDFQTIFYN